jgi:sugar transferase EpsL
MKRTFDLIIATMILLLGSPLLLLISLLVRIWLGSSVFFRQLRPGLRETPFYLYKFRTMNNDNDLNGVLHSDAQRLTPLGRVLRKFSLDELPQFINVLKGVISLVGPRPLLMEYLPLYNNEQARRHEVKPGITGWAQVNGRNAISWEEKFKLDLWYVEHQSFWFDLKILWLTFSKVIRFEDINQPGNATMENFKGFL